MEQENIVGKNRGVFKHGHSPWNKGMVGNHLGNMTAVKGVQGFPCKPVLVIGQDGKVVKRLASVKAAREFLRVKSNRSITHACRGEHLCRGYKLLYEEDYVGWAEYRYKPTPGRDIYGRLQPGHHVNILMRKPSAETREVMTKKKRELSSRMFRDPCSRWAKGVGQPVMCVDTVEYFRTIKEAAKHFGLVDAHISGAISRNGRVHGLKFVKVGSRVSLYDPGKR